MDGLAERGSACQVLQRPQTRPPMSMRHVFYHTLFLFPIYVIRFIRVSHATFLPTTSDHVVVAPTLRIGNDPSRTILSSSLHI